MSSGRGLENDKRTGRAERVRDGDGRPWEGVLR